MLNFKNTSIIFSALLLLLLLCNLKFAVPGLFYWILVIAYSLLLFYGSYRVDSGFYIQVICSAKTDQNEIALSFDDGPALEFTPEILEVLKENQVPAAFFLHRKPRQRERRIIKTHS
jgi:peptidoglycan/xylan/chitin deacetylase (PgdA/CDA1 family)